VRFALSPERQQFADTLHRALGHPPYDLAALGVTDLAQESPVDLAVAFEELGHHAVPGPLADSIAAGEFELGALAVSAQLLGSGRAMLELAVDHARRRTQFGRPIGAFQAVRHQLADVHVALELARPLVFGAAVTLEPRDVSAAKVAAGEAAYRVARTALQVHGAIGYTLEHPLSRWLTTVRALRASWGTPAFHRDRIMTELCHAVLPGGTPV
jgi:hypothetical protein